MQLPLQQGAACSLEWKGINHNPLPSLVRSTPSICVGATTAFDLHQVTIPHQMDMQLPLQQAAACSLKWKQSTATPVLSGVHQGSVLGLLLFLIYINDWANGSHSGGCFVSLYADDLLLYKIIFCPDDYTSLQLDINSVANWINQHHLSLKVKCMTVRRL